MNKSNMRLLIICYISTFIMCIICLYILSILSNKEVYNETNTYVQYIERSEQNEDNDSLPIAGIVKELYTIMSDQSLLGDTSYSIGDVTGTDSCINFENYPDFDYTLSISENDKYLLAKLNECEAGNQNIETRELIVLVVLNRAFISDSFPNTIEEVIKEKHNGVYQFSPLMKGGSWYDTEPTEDAYLAVENVINSNYDFSDGALYFESYQDGETWQSTNLEFLYQSQDVMFYR